MSQSVNLPALGESVTEGTVTRWLKNVGDHVEVDEPLVEVSTDKVDTEIPSPIAGVIEAILVQEDETVEVGTALVTIGDGSDSGEPAEPAGAAEDQSSEAPAENETPPTEAPSAQTPVSAESANEPAENVGAASTAPPAADGSMPSPATPDSSTAPEYLPSVPPSIDAEASAVGGDDAESEEVPAAQAAEPGRAAEPAQAAESAESDKPEADQPAVETPAEAPETVSSAGYVTPLVRKLANEKGIDLNTVNGSGVGGRIRKQDLTGAVQDTEEPAAAAAEPSIEVSPLRGTTVPMSRLRKVVAERAVASMQTSAQLTTVIEVDITRIANLRDKVKADFLDKTGNKLSFLPFFALATAEALKAFPIINATIDNDSIVYPAQENMSIAVDTDRGLLTPVVRDAGSLNLAGFAEQIADLAARTRDNSLKPDELAGGTFTLTNTGSRGALFDTPVVFLPQSAILGTGIVTKRPVVLTSDGVDSIAVRSMVYLALSYDHRIIDGADASRFLVAIKTRLEEGHFSGDLGI